MLFLFAASAGPLAYADTSKASSWKGRIVVTDDGELLGRVEDLAVNVEAKSIDFVVVSIGSFLVDDNLIAVHPDALGVSEDGQYLVLYSDNLGQANRFGERNWPSQADVLASTDRKPVIDVNDDASIPADASARSHERVATISNGRRTSTLKAGNNQLQFEREGDVRESDAPVAVRPKKFSARGGSEPLLADSEFDRMDEDGDGYLSRSEIGLRLNQDIKYQDYDLDGNDGIDAFEFQLLKERG